MKFLVFLLGGINLFTSCSIHFRFVFFNYFVLLVSSMPMDCGVHFFCSAKRNGTKEKAAQGTPLSTPRRNSPQSLRFVGLKQHGFKGLAFGRFEREGFSLYAGFFFFLPTSEVVELEFLLT